MPKWIHDRAEHLLAKNPSMPKSQAFAIATQQAHAVGKSPKGYGTSEGRSEAKKKYDTPKDDKKTANPGKLESTKMANPLMKISMFEAFCDEMANLSSTDFLDNLFKIAALPPATLAPGGMMHAESMLAGLAKKTLPRTGRIAGEHNAIVNMARRAGHAGEGGSSIKSLIPGSSKPSMPPASHGFSIPPLSSSAPGATLPPQATIPAPRAA